MIAVKEPGMNLQDFAAVVEVDQTTNLRLAHKGDPFRKIHVHPVNLK